MNFAAKLLDWYKKNGRDLPWRQTNDPYIIWLSEIILQQTRVEQGTPYFYAFVEAFPDIKSFAEADEEEILRLWQGLGYYSRARNMHKAAQQVMEDFGGNFPRIYEHLVRLKGVGDYTAAAISSFSSNEQQAVVDGNVFRVLSRVFGIDIPINSSEGQKLFKKLASELLSKENPGQYNHAIMDFGAIQCRPKLPLCDTCIFVSECEALKTDQVQQLPVKLKGKKSRNRYFNYFVFEKDGHFLVSRRAEGDIWTNLYEFPLIETKEEASTVEIYDNSDFKKHFGNAIIEPIGGQIKQVLSHQNIFARFYKVLGIRDVVEKKISWNYCLSEKIDTLAKHKLIFTFWNKYLNS